MGAKHLPELNELALRHEVGLNVVSDCDLNLRHIVFLVIASYFFLAINIDLCDDECQFLIDFGGWIVLCACLAVDQQVNELLLVVSDAVFFCHTHYSFNFYVLVRSER